ncbi:hypothetical protein D3C87_2116230 [compost metagenome]
MMWLHASGLNTPKSQSDLILPGENPASINAWMSRSEASVGIGKNISSRTR